MQLNLSKARREIEGRALALIGLSKNSDDIDIIFNMNHLRYIGKKMISKASVHVLQTCTSPLDTYILNKRKESHKWLAE